MGYTFEEIADILDNIVDALPEYLLQNLNGIYLSEDTKHNDKIPSDAYYVMGTYFADPRLGNRIELYYGSIIKVHNNLPLSDMCTELQKIVRHELWHHVETMAGCSDLVKEDEEYVEKALKILNERT